MLQNFSVWVLVSVIEIQYIGIINNHVTNYSQLLKIGGLLYCIMRSGVALEGGGLG